MTQNDPYSTGTSGWSYNHWKGEILMRSGAVFCNIDFPSIRKLDWVTAPVAYIRLHGRTQWYDNSYSVTELQEIQHHITVLREKGANTVYIFFNNDYNGYAPRNALTLKRLLYGHA